MRQAFIRTVKGNTLEFNRILYPTKYAILSQDVVNAGIVVVVERDENGIWSINSLDRLPVWVNEIASDIYEVIEQNEDSINIGTRTVI